MQTLLEKIKCMLGYHKWINISNAPYPEIPEGGYVDVSELHECERCKKKAMLGMGRFF